MSEATQRAVSGALTRGRAGFVVVLTYSLAVLGVRLFLAHIEDVYGYEDDRDAHITYFFGIVVAFMAALSLRLILRRPVDPAP